MAATWTSPFKPSKGKPLGCVTAGELHYPALEQASKVPVIDDPVIYTDPSRPVDARVADLVRRMSLLEKVGQMVNSAKSIDRLEVPAYDYWNECLHGVARAGHATVFPQAIGLAATWDPELIRDVADVISTEARAKYNEAVRQKRGAIYNGLTFWSPNINLFRDPRWGRGHETYGEDPFLTGTIGVAFIKGLQGDDPKYLKLVATAGTRLLRELPASLRDGRARGEGPVDHGRVQRRVRAAGVREPAAARGHSSQAVGL
jgi:hypothetical protein